jgi:hypothetical protein
MVAVGKVVWCGIFFPLEVGKLLWWLVDVVVVVVVVVDGG